MSAILEEDMTKRLQVESLRSTLVLSVQHLQKAMGH